MSQDGVSIIDNNWLEHYTLCENNLKKIQGILHNKEFMDFYDDTSDHWQNHIIEIYNLSSGCIPFRLKVKEK